VADLEANKALACRLAMLAAVMLPALVHAAAAPEWKPDKRAEIIVTTAPGGGNDKVARLLQKIAQENRLVELTPTVVNKPGGSGVLAMNYLNQHAGDGHFLVITSVTFLAEIINGRNNIAYTDVTPVALLFNEYVGFGVKTDSRIKSGRDLIALLKADAGSVSAAISGVGNHNHIALGMVAKASGGEVRRLKVASFNSGGEAMTAALGGHVDLVVAPFATLLPQVQSGRLRMIGITAPKRVSGPLASVPTWTEQGANAVISNWRVVLGPRGMTVAKADYWENVFAKAVETDDWNKMLEQDQVTGGFLKSNETRAYLKAQYDELKVVMTDLGLVR
jgi:putative tricarboxylic transport membrane protein